MRWLILGLLFAISVVTYIDRVNISVTARQMMPALGLTDQQMGLIFSAFVIGYALFQVPGGWLADRWGIRIVLTVALLWWSGLEAAQFDFTDPKVAVLGQRSSGQDVVWEIGTDGHYRQLDPSGDALLGYWEDANTFNLHIFDLCIQEYQVVFQGDSVQVISKEADLVIPCKVSAPST